MTMLLTGAGKGSPVLVPSVVFDPNSITGASGVLVVMTYENAPVAATKVHADPEAWSGAAWIPINAGYDYALGEVAYNLPELSWMDGALQRWAVVFRDAGDTDVSGTYASGNYELSEP